jgi:DNA polymerase-3 subunit gamma/tau
MSYQVIARKYRPQNFSDVIGQEHVTRTLKNAIEQGRIAHGYIFSGHRGIGKTTVARILAMGVAAHPINRWPSLAGSVSRAPRFVREIQ